MDKYDYFFLGGLALWVAETAYFGFNAEPINGVEKLLDQVAFALMAVGGIATLFQALKTTVNVNIKGKADIE